MPNLAAPKTGRPREYTFSPNPDFANAEVAYFMVALDEAHARVHDQIVDLPPRALAFTPENTTLSIGALVIHMVWAEAGWIARISGMSIPDDLGARLNPIGRAIPAGEAPPPAAYTAAELRSLGQCVRDTLTFPALANLVRMDSVIPDQNRAMTPRGVLMHLVWHWTYHSGQIGLLRELWGAQYTWTFGSLGAQPAP